ncbi:MAG: hypothetical protein ABGZ35_11695 [Planctomycetaceae bacterium]
MSGNGLFAYDLTIEGSTLPGRFLGTLIRGAKSTDCRAMCVGPSGAAWCAVTEKVDGINLLHLVRYRPRDKAPVDLGAVAVRNLGFSDFKGKDDKPLPFHGGFTKLKNEKTVTRYVILGVCETKDGNVNILALHPYSVLQFRVADISAAGS